MTRRMEGILRKLLNTLSAALIVAAVVLGIQIAVFKPSAAKIESPRNESSKDQIGQEPQNPMLTRLSGLKMSKTVSAPTAEAVQKPLAPALGTLIHVKGIMDFGDPKTCEAIIESVRANKMRNYKIGETVDGISAVVTKIDSAVTFNYDGKSVTLNVNSGESVQGPPTAGRENSPVVAEEKVNRPAP
jgi:hypothetical protein